MMGVISVLLLLLNLNIGEDFSFFDLKVHGYYRTRYSFFYNADLDNGMYSGFTPSVSENSLNMDLNKGSDLISGVDSRMMLKFSGGVDDVVSIKGRIDLFDNFVWGKGKNFTSPYSPLPFFYETDAGYDKDFMKIKELFGVFAIFRNVVIDGGRRCFNWGNGFLFNSGDDLDDDFGTFFDGAQIFIRFLSYELEFAYELQTVGAVYDLQRNYEGQPYDLGNVDDVRQWRFYIKKEHDKSKKGFGGGFLNVFRTQDLSSENPDWYSFGESLCRMSDSDTIGLNYDCYTLTPRDFFLWIPDVYWFYVFNSQVEIGFEFASFYGSIGNATETAKKKISSDILSFGGLFYLKVKKQQFKFFLETGFATGDKDFPEFMGQGYDPEGKGYKTYWKWNESSKITHFLFNRDYRIDLLFFREIKGAIFNAVYLRFNFDFEKRFGKHKLNFIFNPVLSMNYISRKFYGLEADLSVKYSFESSFVFLLQGGFLFPFSGLKNPYTGDDPSKAFTIQAKAFISF